MLKKVNINDVAWIDSTQGQIAKVNNNMYNNVERNNYGRTNNRNVSAIISEHQRYGNEYNKGIINQENQGSKFIGESNESNINRSMQEIRSRNNDRSIEEKANERQNSNSIPNRDDEGKMVSEGQRRFNQNVSPLVKNKNGELLHFFHGTNVNFSEFDLSKGGRSNSKASVGFWFTKSKEGATKWANETLKLLMLMIRIKRIPTNVSTSAYGRNNYEKWIESNKDKIIYDTDDGIIKKELMANGYNCQVASIHLLIILP